MTNKDYVLMMARYNLWQNENLLSTTDSLSSSDRRLDRGAFFGSIEKTLSHLYWADRIWMHRFAGTPEPAGGIPESARNIKNWQSFREERKTFDERILQWAHEVDASWFDGDLSWFSGAMGCQVTKPKNMLVIQLFNHQTHHRGQVHAMLTAAGVKPSDTDVPFMPKHFLTL
ncbi:DinB family protein [Cohaesibacter gelatinilyticus]|uniref:Uncharacterized damage-inducible protein DinB (Forms a four-helix bundle) n=1 Tax=Cohaesibacter gelatinilyticus TaxID=372072 RepID=A0A285PGJ6_9HYPH|nr:DinB family protein [Cohaesibacter gelatinilyticus]SNZ20855.1 Uncharacterized damage-inducible protein DinB (forms a four-helix bundle) [Cohaesibacter gelatinilyticus]HAT86799.1 damage-inducible protein DinB [Hyphomicrobiales bacterium]